MGRGIRRYAEHRERLRQVNADKQRIPVTMPWLIREASRQLEGLDYALRGGASDATVLNETAERGHPGRRIRARNVMP